MTDLTQIWTYLAEEPLLWLTATLIAYSIGDALFKASGNRPYVNPVLIAVALLAIVLYGTATPYQTYFEGAQFVHFMLGPATVALAAPLYANLSKIRTHCYSDALCASCRLCYRNTQRTGCCLRVGSSR